MARKLFCEISPLTYKISTMKCRAIRHIKTLFIFYKIARKKQTQQLPVLIYSHKSLIRRKLGDVDLELQNNKAINLSIAAPKISNVLIRPGEIFSFWSLVGNCTKKKGYKDGLTIHLGEPSKGMGGGMCQFTNLIHWLVLHTPMEIIEHHHHDGIDLFPDYGRQVPFGVGTSILYNYLDYRFVNNTSITFQLITYTDEKYLCGEIRANEQLSKKYHIVLENEFFCQEQDGIYRNGRVYRNSIDKNTGDLVCKELIKTNHARVLYDISSLNIDVTAK
ncbi:MAG: VanW family protein [Angelakisella sp.]